jgi:hypothetical protein
MMKMYILVRELIPPGFAILGTAHGSIACYIQYQDHPDTIQWLSGPFHKVVCKVSDMEFEQAKMLDDHVLITESKLDGAEVALAFRPRANWPDAFKYFRLYR